MLDQVTVIGVCGAGAMGAGITQIAAQAGHQVIVLDRDDEALARGCASVKKGASALLKRGKITAEEASTLADRVQWTLDAAHMAPCGLIIEAIVENADVKTSLFKSLEQATGDDAIIATNTSSLSVTSLAGGHARPDRFLGLHFFNPAPVMKLVEVVSGAETDPAIAVNALSLMESWGKVAVKVRDVPGFIVNRVARPYYSEGWRAYEEGASDAATFDFLYRELAGFRMGPFELGDLIGHDINTATAKSIFEAYEGRTRFTPTLAQEQLVAAGRLGRKSGRGVYDYSEGAEKPAPSFSNCAPAGSPGKIALGDNTTALQVLFKTGGVDFETREAIPAGFAQIRDTFVGFSDGRTAGECADIYQRPVAVIDWMRDPTSVSVLAFSPSCDDAREVALTIATALDKKTIELKDRAGLVVFRTLCQLANCAADAVRDQVADAESIDRAMMNGVNYPFGPMAWAKEFTISAVVGALKAIANETGEALYNPCEVLQALARRQT